MISEYLYRHRALKSLKRQQQAILDKAFNDEDPIDLKSLDALAQARADVYGAYEIFEIDAIMYNLHKKLER